MDLEPSDELSNRTLPAMVSLVYRDDIYQKHADKARLRAEIAAGKGDDDDEDGADGAAATRDNALDFRCEMMMRHLLQATRPRPNYQCIFLRIMESCYSCYKLHIHLFSSPSLRTIIVTRSNEDD